jgi:ABC-type glycerol-3-phosphate transport system permease component
MRLGGPSARRLALLRAGAQLITHLFLIGIVLVSVVPFLWMFFSSFKTFKEITSSAHLLPEVWTLENYQTIIFRVNFPQALANSTLVAALVTLATLVTSAAAGYVFAKYKFWGKETLFLLVLSTLMVPFAVVMVPLYIIIADFGLINQLSGLVVTGLFSTFGIFMLRQFMEGIPDDLLSAGRIDGAAEWWIFTHIVVPLAMSPLAALAVFTFLGNWDSYLWPLVVLTSPDRQTLPLLLAGLRNMFSDRYELWATGSMLTVTPAMLLYAVAQKQFIRGVTMTGLKA